jgi:glycosyltransferase involved in cell wall biosynthesis
MASILRAPTDQSCGVMVVTTPERDHQIKKSPALRASIERLKGRWLVGLHHNWHDWHFKYDPLFDFSMAGDGDLKEVGGREFPRIPMDACNFVPNTFRPGTGEKFWDILYVARAVFFKRIPEFFQVIRQLYDQGHKYRVLLICPVPPYDRKQKKTVFYKIRESYDRMFSETEKNLFNLLTIEYRYPFPFDLDTLAHFYRSSRIFVHTADDERRCRVASYAWASGLPIVGMECVTGLLPAEVRHPPYLYEAKSYENFPELIVSALSNTSHDFDQKIMRETFSESSTPDKLDRRLEEVAGERGLPYQLGGLSRTNLSIRLGRHHDGIQGPNSLKTSLPELVDWLALNDGRLSDFLGMEDPESAIQASISPTKPGRFFDRFSLRDKH